MNLYTKIVNYFYTRSCLQLISEDTNMLAMFSIKNDETGVIHKFPKYGWFTGSLVIIFRIEKSESDHKEIIREKISLMDDLSISMGITDIVTSNLRFLDTDERYSFYMIKFSPTFDWSIFDIVTLVILGIIGKLVYVGLSYFGFFKLTHWIWEILTN